MSWLQRFFQRYFPEAAKSMEADSREWMVQCSSCGFEQSIWDLGGIRWKASRGGKRTWMRCRQCRNFVGHRVYRKRAGESGSTHPLTEG